MRKFSILLLFITTFLIPPTVNATSFSEVTEIDDYLWFLSCTDNELYSGAYRLETASNTDNYYYKINTTEGTSTGTKIDSGGESTRVYDLNGEFYATSEGGKVYKNGSEIGDISTKYILGATYYDGRYLISRASTSPQTDVYDCSGSSCSLIETLDGIFGFHMQVYNGELYHIGTGSDYTSDGKVYKGSTEILSSVPGAGVRATVYDDKLFVGFSGAGKSGGSAQIKSYDGTSWTDVKTFSGFHHFGDFELVGTKLYVAVVEEEGHPEVWSYDGTDWTKDLSSTDLSKYGVNSELINGGGFLQVCNDKLYMNINTTTNYREGPGYILEIDADTTDTPTGDDEVTTGTSADAVISLTSLQGGGGVIIRNDNRSEEEAVLLDNLEMGFAVSAGYTSDGTTDGGTDDGGGGTTIDSADQIDCDSLSFLGTDTEICDWEVTSDLEVVVDSGLITMDQTLTDTLSTVEYDGYDMAANCWVAMEIEGTWYTSTFEWMPEGTHSKETKAVAGDHAKKSPEIPTTWLPTDGQELYFAVSGLARGGVENNAQERTPFVKYYWNSETPGTSLASMVTNALADFNLAETTEWTGTRGTEVASEDFGSIELLGNTQSIDLSSITAGTYEAVICSSISDPEDDINNSLQLSFDDGSGEINLVAPSGHPQAGTDRVFLSKSANSCEPQWQGDGEGDAAVDPPVVFELSGPGTLYIKSDSNVSSNPTIHSITIYENTVDTTDTTDTTTTDTTTVGSADTLVQIGFKGDSAADLSFAYGSDFNINVTSGSISNIIETSSQISFTLSDSDVELTVENLGVYVTNGSARDTEQLEILVGGHSYYAENFFVFTYQGLTDVKGGGGVEVEYESIDNETATELEPLILEGDFGLGELVEVYFAGDSAATLSFDTTENGITFLAQKQTDSTCDASTETCAMEEDPNIEIIDPMITTEKISFRVLNNEDPGDGTTQLTLSGIGVYIASGDAIDTDKLAIRMIVEDGDSESETEYFGENFDIDTFPDYADGSGSFAEPTGNDDYYIIGDKITYSPPEDNHGEDFTVNLSSVGLTQFLEANDDYEIVEGTGDGEYDFEITVDYGGGWTKTFRSPQIKIDNIIMDTTGGGIFYSQNDVEGGSGFNGAFIVGDNLKYIPPTYADEEVFVVDMTPLALTETEEAEKEYESSEFPNADYDGVLQVKATDDAGNIVEYETSNLIFDNIVPSFSGWDLNGFIEITNGKDVQGIGDTITIRVPTDQNGDQTSFTSDLSEIGGDVANYEGQVGDTEIVLLEKPIDEPDFSRTINFYDDAGNVPSDSNSYTTAPAFDVDLIYPRLATNNLLIITEGDSPASMGDEVQLQLAEDSAERYTPETKMSADLSEIGGSEVNFVQVTATQTITITAGALQNEPYQATVTVYDKAENAIAIKTNEIMVDNKPPDFNSTCGGNIKVIDKGSVDTNQIADFSNGEPDEVELQAPNSAIEGCDFNTFSVDFYTVNNEWEEVQYTAEGQKITTTVGEGTLDSSTHSAVLKIYDEFGNYAEYASGTFSIDNDLIQETETQISSEANSYSTPNMELFPDTEITASLKTIETDIVKVEGEMNGAAQSQTLNENSDAQNWLGQIKISVGELIEQWRNILYKVTDDAGNTVYIEGVIQHYITNNTTVQHGGGGGTADLHRTDGGSISERKRGVVRRQIEEYRERRENASLYAEMILKKNYETITPNKINHDKSYLSVFKASLEKAFVRRKEEQKQIARGVKRPMSSSVAVDKEPKKLENTIRNLGFKSSSPKQWNTFKDDNGGFRAQNTLNNYRKFYQKKKSKLPGTLRTTELSKRGKYGTYRPNKEFMNVK